MNKTQKTFIVLLAIFSLLHLIVSGQTTRDSIIYTPVTVRVTHDSSYVAKVQVSHDSTYTRIDTIKIPVPAKDTLWRGMYVNSTSSVAGDKTKEDALIKDCNKLKLTHLSFYSTSGANATNLAKLFVRIRKETGVKELARCPGGSSSITSANNWNASQPDSSDYDVYNLEYEPWNATDVATAWSNNRTYLQQMASAVKAGIIDRFTDYYGWWTKVPMNTQTPDTLVKYLSVGSNFFLLHDYRVTPDIGYMKTRLTNLNDAAKRQGKTIRLRPIFSAEPDFLGPWLKSGHTLEEAFTILHAGFKALNLSNINMDGWMCFHIDFWRAHLPPAPAMARGMKPEKVKYNSWWFINKTTRKSKRIAKESL